MQAFENRNREISDIGVSTVWSISNPRISVMLPTFRRLDALDRTLAVLERQSVAHVDCEIIVVDDGSRDGTETYLADFSKKTSACFSYIVLAENGGPARARNFGLSRCRGDVILIIGDDIEPEKDLVERHLRSHQENQDERHAVLGHVSFPDELQPNEFMKWLEGGGRKYFFNYGDLVSGEETGPLYFYTCNVSVKRSLLEKSGWFDESFPYASHEDLELGYRLANQGMRLIYDAQAEGYHYHKLSVQGITRRIYLMGYSAELFWQKVNERGGAGKQALRSIITWCAATPPGLFIWKRLAEKTYADRKPYPVQWHVLLFLSFFIGLSDSKKRKALRV